MPIFISLLVSVFLSLNQLNLLMQQSTRINHFITVMVRLFWTLQKDGIAKFICLSDPYRNGYVLTWNFCFSERAGAEVLECACVIEIPALKVFLSVFSLPFRVILVQSLIAVSYTDFWPIFIALFASNTLIVCYVTWIVMCKYLGCINWWTLWLHYLFSGIFLMLLIYISATLYTMMF